MRTTTTSRLRLRFLASLAASGALVGGSVSACGGAVESTGSSGTSGSSGSSGSSGTGTSGTPGTSGSSAPIGSSTSSPPSSPSGNLPTSSPGPAPAAVCTYGTPTSACYTHEQLVAQLNQTGGGDSSDAGQPDADTSPSFDSHGCLPGAMVRDDCCNPAVGGPAWTGTTCCYVFCSGSCCGRPFLVAGEARVAGLCERDDWMLTTSAHDAPTSYADVPASGTHRIASARAHGELNPQARARIGAAWARDAAMEHASVASFARFTLELLALGAPADLVLSAQDATRDEIEHARACFTIAARYTGRPVGPSKLDVGGATPAIDLAAAVDAAIGEGCVGETLSALLAETRLARAEDGDVRAALRRIANEEARHAELAWRFVGWAIATGGDDIRATANRAFERALAGVPQSWDAELRGLPRETLRAHGLLDEAAAREVTERALHEVIAPCAAALIAAVATAA